MNEKYVDIDFAKLDIERQKRRGCSEAVFCECKTEEQLVKIFSEFQKQGQNVLGTRVTQSQAQVLQKKFSGLYYNSQARIVKLIQKEINKLANKYMNNWTIDRLNKVDKAILSLAIYELMYTDTPSVVAINEAIELSKKYSEEAVTKMINGVLDKIYHEEEK